MIPIAVESEFELAGWHTLLDLSEWQKEGWTLIGAQMVALHAFEHGLAAPRSSRDFDLLVNVRLLHDGTEAMTRRLLKAGFELDEPSPGGLSHRLRSDKVVIDVLAPDGIGARASTTTLPPARTVKVPGGSQALKRTARVPVNVQGRDGELPRPGLLGAILVKARAVSVSDAAGEQLRDLAFLCTLVSDPREMATAISSTERRWLRAHPELAGNGPAWAGRADAEDGRLAFRILSGL